MPAAQKHGGPIDPAPEKERERLPQKGFLPDLETVTDEMSARLWQKGRRVPAERIREAFREHPLLQGDPEEVHGRLAELGNARSQGRWRTLGEAIAIGFGWVFETTFSLLLGAGPAQASEWNPRDRARDNEPNSADPGNSDHKKLSGSGFMNEFMQRPQSGSASQEPDRRIDFAKECERLREEPERQHSAEGTSAHRTRVATQGGIGRFLYNAAIVSQGIEHPFLQDPEFHDALADQQAQFSEWRVGTRVLGGLQSLGGAAQIMAAPSVGPAGPLLGALGADNVMTGLRTVWTGEHQDTSLSDVIRSTGETTGLYGPNAVPWIEAGVNLGTAFNPTKLAPAAQSTFKAFSPAGKDLYRPKPIAEAEKVARVLAEAKPRAPVMPTASTSGSRVNLPLTTPPRLSEPTTVPPSQPILSATNEN